MSPETAIVTGIYADGITLQINGENTSKRYKCNREASFGVGDYVKICKISGTYIVEYPIGNPGSRDTLIFYINDDAYYARSGDSINAWISTGYNTDGYSIISDGGKYFLTLDGITKVAYVPSRTAAIISQQHFRMELLTFQIDGVQQQCYPDTRFSDWINSSFNTAGYVIERDTNINLYFVALNGVRKATIQSNSATIEQNHNYTVLTIPFKINGTTFYCYTDATGTAISGYRWTQTPLNTAGYTLGYPQGTTAGWYFMQGTTVVAFFDANSTTLIVANRNYTL